MSQGAAALLPLKEDEELVAMCLSTEGWDPNMESILAEDDGDLVEWVLGTVGGLQGNGSVSPVLSSSSSTSSAASSWSRASSLACSSEGEEDAFGEASHGGRPPHRFASLSLAIPTIPPSTASTPLLAPRQPPPVSVVAAAPGQAGKGMATTIPSVLAAGGVEAPVAPEARKAKGTVDLEERRRKNRESADRSRAKKRRLLEALPKEKQALETQVRDLERRLAELENENSTLKEQNVFLRRLVTSGAAPLRGGLPEWCKGTFRDLPASSGTTTSAASVVLMAVACLGVFRVAGTNIPAVLGHASGLAGGARRSGRLLLGVDGGPSPFGLPWGDLDGSGGATLVLFVLLTLAVAVASSAARSLAKARRGLSGGAASSELPVWDSSRRAASTAAAAVAPVGVCGATGNARKRGGGGGSTSWGWGWGRIRSSSSSSSSSSSLLFPAHPPQQQCRLA
eukprot:CAMPEP_0118964208 /NCGR_PEP_ID=MMETSP1173-20130426/1937_1 /TAXON_ID=1034831 /ORGANISM="Rhizochromulina marina cf, Strain CCMP1243" /LENGTH=452 /DNA_ID=CAMNT_0006912639 /DNA_START=40 /DNA_END=1398 /DNA_ORIENTATION=-